MEARSQLRHRPFESTSRSLWIRKHYATGPLIYFLTIAYGAFGPELKRCFAADYNEI